LPWDTSFLTPDGGEGVICYGIPFTGPAPEEFTIALAPREPGRVKKMTFPRGTAPPGLRYDPST
jgi:hypothetical protein